MIGKAAKLTVPQSGGIVKLIDYLLDTKNVERIGEVWISNCATDEVEWAKEEMYAVQQLNTRSKSEKTYHLIVSFPEGEWPTLEQMKVMEERFSKALGFQEHQRICVVHHDTDNVHFHMAINKIHPEKYTSLTPKEDYQTIAKVCIQLEQELGLKHTNHTTHQNTGASTANTIERAAGLESLVGYIQRNCSQKIEKAEKWEDIHNALGQHGLEAKPTRNGVGLVFYDKENDIAVKASTVSRDFSFGKLVSRLGPYKPLGKENTIPPAKQYKKHVYDSRKSGKEALAELWEKYTQEKNQRNETVKVQTKQINTERQKAIDEIRNDAERQKKMLRVGETLSLKGRLGKSDRTAIRIAMKTVEARKKQKIEDVQNAAKRKKERLHVESPQFDWMDWVRKQAQNGDICASQYLQGRKQREATVCAIRGERINLTPTAGKTVTKVGTALHSKAIKETASKVELTGATDEDIKDALLIARERFGSVLTLEGDKDFHRRAVRQAVAGRIECTFTDPVLERYRQDLIKRSKKEQAENPDRWELLKYIAKRNETRLLVSDMLEYRLVESMDSGEARMHGYRNIGSQKVALLEKDNVILVVPLKDGKESFKKGSTVTISSNGSLKQGLVR